MNQALRKIAFFAGIGILVVSMYWSQDGFNFEVAGDSGYGNMAMVIGWFLAVVVSVIQFVFSSNYKDLNPSLILFGILAYAYSIYTNYQGILHFQGTSQSAYGAAVLAAVMDGVAEPLIAWGLYESLAGDFIGNILKTVLASPDRIASRNQSENRTATNTQKMSMNQEKVEELPKLHPSFGNNSPKIKENLHRVKPQNQHHNRFE